MIQGQMIQENMKEANSVLLLSFGKHTLGFLQFSFSYADQPYLMWEGVHKGIKTRREGSWESSWKLATTVGDNEHSLGCSVVNVKYLCSIEGGVDSRELGLWLWFRRQMSTGSHQHKDSS